jgi:hypothetical protein
MSISTSARTRRLRHSLIAALLVVSGILFLEPFARAAIPGTADKPAVKSTSPPRRPQDTPSTSPSSSPSAVPSASASASAAPSLVAIPANFTFQQFGLSQIVTITFGAGVTQITAASSNPAVATVTPASQSVTGPGSAQFTITSAQAPGDATIVFSAGSQTVTVPISVPAGVSTPPPGVQYLNASTQSAVLIAGALGGSSGIVGIINAIKRATPNPAAAQNTVPTLTLTEVQNIARVQGGGFKILTKPSAQLTGTLSNGAPVVSIAATSVGDCKAITSSSSGPVLTFTIMDGATTCTFNVTSSPQANPTTVTISPP